MSHTEAAETKQNGKTVSLSSTSPALSSRSSPVSPSGNSGSNSGKLLGNSIQAELNAKITAKQNTRLKQHGAVQNGKSGKNLSMSDLSTANLISDRLHSSHISSPNAELKKLYHQPVKLLNNNSMGNKSLMNDHDVESRLSASKIAISAFKSANKSALSSAGLALNLKRSEH